MAVYGNASEFLKYFGGSIISEPQNTTLKDYINNPITDEGLSLAKYLSEKGVDSTLTFKQIIATQNYFNIIDSSIALITELLTLKEEVTVTNEYGEDVQTFTAAIEVTVDKMNGLIENSKLEPGQLYLIKEADYQFQTDVIVRAVSKNALAKEGYGKFYNPIYTEVEGYGIWAPIVRFSVQNVIGVFDDNEDITTDNSQTGTIIGNVAVEGGWTFVSDIGTGTNDWTGATTFTGDTSGASAEIYDLVVPQYPIGSTVIYGGLVWKNHTGNIGSSFNEFDLNEDWEPLNPKLVENQIYYNVVWDQIEYDIETDFITMRKDKSNNITIQTYWEYWDSENPRAIKLFQWGNEPRGYNGPISSYNRGLANNNIDGRSYVNLVNFRGQQCFDNVFKNYTSFGYATVFEVGTRIRYNTFDNSFLGFTFLGGDSMDFNRNVFYDSSFVDNTYVGFGDFDDNYLQGSGLYGNLVVNGYITYNVLKADSYISNNKLYGYSKMFENNLSGNAYIENNEMTDSSGINDNNLRSNSYISNNTMDSSPIYSNEINSESFIVGNTLINGSDIYGNSLTSQGKIINSTLENNADIYHNNISNDSAISVTLDNNVISNCTLLNNYTLSTNATNTTFLTTAP